MSQQDHDRSPEADGSDRPSVDQPLNAEPRPQVTPVLAVVALLVVVGAVFALITWTRYAT
ncbi:hypothetical protein [Nocardioides nanhaiensis]|uniref:Uncharacterized protein n=1 Tax=Nocardioides nanhaiensis TaxID=1476871 RepID=A0ABP8WGZ3_9ACTN